MAILLQRICWNEYLWARPSGLPKDAGYPREKGFGGDEWNFNLGDSYKGYVYGHTPYAPSARAKATLPPVFCVAFWTKHPETDQIFLVGFYESAEWTSGGQSMQFDLWLRKSSRWERRRRELLSVTRLSKAKIDAEFPFPPRGYIWWKLRCPTGKVQLVDGWMSIPKMLVEKHQRFAKPRIWRGGSASSDLIKRCSVAALAYAPPQLGYERITPNRVAIIDQNEERLREQFLSFLRSQPQRFSGVQREVEQNDVRFRCKGEHQIAELKSGLSYPTIHHALRTGLGQLLSYNYAPGRTPARRWWLVLDCKPDADSKRFIRNVAVAHQMPLVIAYRTTGPFKLWDPLQLRTR